MQCIINSANTIAAAVCIVSVSVSVCVCVCVCVCCYSSVLLTAGHTHRLF